MTMPHLMNCPHSGEGWCLVCVKKLYDESFEHKVRRSVVLFAEAMEKRLARFGSHDYDDFIHTDDRVLKKLLLDAVNNMGVRIATPTEWVDVAITAYCLARQADIMYPLGAKP